MFDISDHMDLRVPVSELESRQSRLADALAESGHKGALVMHPVDLHYLCGGRQNSSFFLPASGTGGDGPIQWVRRSLPRAQFDAGGDDSPHEIAVHPNPRRLDEILSERGVKDAPSLQLQDVPQGHISRFWSSLRRLDGNSEPSDASPITRSVREIKSDWEIERMRESAVVQSNMFEAIMGAGGVGKSELELAAVAEKVSRSSGFGGHVRCRRYPMSCDRAVIVAGRSGGVPSFFDAAVGGLGPHPAEGMGSGMRVIKQDEPVLIDLVHAHRGYIVDMTRMFVSGQYDRVWDERLEDTREIETRVVQALSRGETCTNAWREGSKLAAELGRADNLMGQTPDQTHFLGHSIGLELDESPVVAEGFDCPLPIGGVMAIEPKLVYENGAIGVEDSWLRTEEGLEPITHRSQWDPLVRWD